MAQVKITSGPRNGGAETTIYEVVADDGSTGLLATSSEPRLEVGELVEAARTPNHLQGVEFNGHLVDFFRR